MTVGLPGRVYTTRQMVYEKGHALFWTLVHGRRTPIWLLALSFVNLAVCLFLARQVSVHRAFPFDNDEVAHALPALHMLRDFGQGNAAGLIRELLGQNFYPPGNSLLLLPTYAAFGASPVVARLVSVVCLFLSVLVLYPIAVEIDPKRGRSAGFIAGVLTLTSRPLLTSSSLVMLEAPGLLIGLLALWAYLRAQRQPNDRRWILAAFLLAAAILTKYSYGVITLAAVAANELVSLRTRQVRVQLRQRVLLLFGVLALLLAGWFMRPGQLAAFFDYARPLSSDRSWLSLNGVLYYTRSFAIHSAPSVAFALLNLAGVLWAIAHWRDGNIRLLVLYFLFGMAAVMLINHPPNPRFIATFVPAAQLLTALMIVRILPGRESDAALARGSQSRPALWAACLFLAVASFPTVLSRYANLPSLIEAQLETAPAPEGVIDWVAGTVPDDGPVYLINYWDQFGPQQLEWAMVSRDASSPQLAGRLMEPFTPERAAELREELRSGAAAGLVLIEGGPWGSPFWPDYSHALAGSLREVDRRSFSLTGHSAGDWLDANSLLGADWEAVKAQSSQTLDINVIVYEIVD